VQDFEDLMTDPQVAHNELIQTIHHPEAGDIRVIGIPMTFSATPGTIRLAPPRIGEHTGAILSELGYTPEQVDALRAEGVI
jgi:crotonobetainyl-CoA:carnitine CoA-transferase CaiB-like acyl-CoA transferase